MAAFYIHSREGVNFVEVMLQNETVRTESGAMRYILGNIQMESKSPGLGGFLKAAVSGENLFRPTYTGTGKLVLEPTVTSFFQLDLRNESYVLDQGAYWASEASIEVSAKANRAITGLTSGEGFFQTTVTGTGAVIVQIPGPVEVIDLVNNKLVVDGSFAVARSSTLAFRVERSTKSLVGSMTSGEGYVNVLEGTGRVYLCPVPYWQVVFQQMIAGMAASRSG